MLSTLGCWLPRLHIQIRYLLPELRLYGLRFRGLFFLLRAMVRAFVSLGKLACSGFEGLGLRVVALLLMIQSCVTLRTLNHGNYGIFLIMRHAGFLYHQPYEPSWPVVLMWPYVRSEIGLVMPAVGIAYASTIGKTIASSYRSFCLSARLE